MCHTTVVGPLTRTYPAATAGSLVGFSFDNVTYAFNMSYALGTAAMGPTEIYVSLRCAPRRGTARVGWCELN
jgi:hypothetical protein